MEPFPAPNTPLRAGNLSLRLCQLLTHPAREKGRIRYHGEPSGDLILRGDLG